MLMWALQVRYSSAQIAAGNPEKCTFRWEMLETWRM